MKKNFEKLISISLAVMSSIFVVFLLVMIFNTAAAEEANNKVVHALFGVFAAIFAILTAINIMSAFSEAEKVNQILLFKTKSREKKASVGLVRKLVKKAAKRLSGVKINHIHLYVDSTNEVIMKAAVRVDLGVSGAQKAADVLDEVNKSIEDEFLNVLGFEFKMIELKLIAVKQGEKSVKQAEAPEDVVAEQKAELKDVAASEVEEVLKAEEKQNEEAEDNGK